MKTVIYTNLDTDDMCNEIRRTLKNVTNKDFIKRRILFEYDYRMISWKERDMLLREFGVA